MANESHLNTHQFQPLNEDWEGLTATWSNPVRPWYRREGRVHEDDPYSEHSVYQQATTYENDPQGSKWQAEVHGMYDTDSNYPESVQAFASPYRTPFRAQVASESLSRRLANLNMDDPKERRLIERSRTLPGGKKAVKAFFMFRHG